MYPRDIEIEISLTLLPVDLLLVLGVIALFTGFIKAGVPSLGALLSACVALVFPARDALGITLMYLLVGDIVAVSLYWRLAHWPELKKMVLPVLFGVGSGGVMLYYLDNESLGLTIGLVVLFLVSLEPFRPRLTEWAFTHPHSARTSSGILAGIATTIGNAAGPILSLYFLLLKLDKKAFIGTGSIFFLFVNISKVPIFMSQGIFKLAYVPSILLTAPLVFAGAIGGRKFLEWIPQYWFNRVILFFTAIAGLWLVLRYFS
ncbi:sulfite exporter TauE/SafE family protein [Gammaproteobacteria bacterium]|nr:sulfite exporter TauE/SafE family protein [Gammaproteobacteria bacterium]